MKTDLSSEKMSQRLHCIKLNQTFSKNCPGDAGLSYGCLFVFFCESNGEQRIKLQRYSIFFDLLTPVDHSNDKICISAMLMKDNLIPSILLYTS